MRLNIRTAIIGLIAAILVGLPTSAVATTSTPVNQPLLTLSKQATIPGSPEWQNQLVAAPGNTVSWKITVGNASAVSGMTGIVVRDVLPAHVTLVPGSVTYYDTKTPQGRVLSDGALFGGGYVLPVAFAPKTQAFIRYRTVIDPSVSATTCGTPVVNKASASAKYATSVRASATVTLTGCSGGAVLPDTGASLPLTASLVGLTILSLTGFYYLRSRRQLIAAITADQPKK